MKLKLKWKIIFSIILILLVMFILLRFIGTSGLRIREYKIINNNLNSFYGLKIVHFTDLHYGMNVNEKKLNNLVNMINKTKPDIVIFTGDLIDKNTKINDEISNTLVKNLSRIESTYGKFYVSGDHDKINSSYDLIMSNSKFKSLNKSYEIIYSKDNKSLFIAGVNVNEKINQDTIEALNLNEYDYKIFALHYPDNIDDILKYNFNLVIAGHSHNGQVRFPVVGAVIKQNNKKKYYDPHYKIDNTEVYISGGIGNSKINFRLFNTPSFNLYRLVDK